MTDDRIRLFYLLIIIIAIMNLGILYSKTNENLGNKREVGAFKGMLLSFMIYSLVDLRLVVTDFYTGFPRLFVLFVMGTGFFAMTCSCYFWFVYVLSSTRIKSKVILIHIAKIPLLLVALALYTPFYTHVYTVTDEPTFSPLLSVILMFDYVYLIIATAISIKKYIQVKNRLERKKYSGQIFYILFYTASGYIMGYFLNIPAIEFCMMPVVLKLFVDLQDSRIYTDALTKLDNRRRIDEYIDQEISTCSKEKPLTVIMIDVDFFKSINDMLGHDEGDAVLVAFSTALTNITVSKYARAARWGGDEFLIAGKEKGLADDFKDKLIKELEKNKELSFVPHFSVGVFTCTSSEMSTKQVVAEADAQLYKDKEIQHKKYEGFQDQIREKKLK